MIAQERSLTINEVYDALQVGAPRSILNVAMNIWQAGEKHVMFLYNEPRTLAVLARRLWSLSKRDVVQGTVNQAG
jgi:hypothetical protein